TENKNRQEQTRTVIRKEAAEREAAAVKREMSVLEQEMPVPEEEMHVPHQEAVIPEHDTIAPEQDAAVRETAAEENVERQDEGFEPMEAPLTIPGTATVADGSRVIDTMYCLQSLCSLIPRKNMALFHNALTCIFEQKDGDEIYAAVKTRPELHTQLWSRYEQDREERIRKYIRLLLDICDYEIQDTDLLYQVYRESYDGSLQALNIGIMKAFGDEVGIRYYRLLRKHINVLTKL
ncbi:MAG: hypothetical protein LUH19_04430, partial [Lachnospiraceae bacterium]|nr:hypothetical protein [Lachnospiraceae bacterium]